MQSWAFNCLWQNLLPLCSFISQELAIQFFLWSGQKSQSLNHLKSHYFYQVITRIWPLATTASAASLGPDYHHVLYTVGRKKTKEKGTVPLEQAPDRTLSHSPSLSCPLLGRLLWRSVVWLFRTLWTIARQAPLCMGFFRQERWSGLPFPLPGHLPDLGIEPKFCISCIAGRFFTIEPSGIKQLVKIEVRACHFSAEPSVVALTTQEWKPKPCTQPWQL